MTDEWQRKRDKLRRDAILERDEAGSVIGIKSVWTCIVCGRTDTHREYCYAAYALGKLSLSPPHGWTNTPQGKTYCGDHGKVAA